MASPSDDILLLLFKTVARLEIKVNALLERDTKGKKMFRERGQYLRQIIQELKKKVADKNRYIKELEKELK